MILGSFLRGAQPAQKEVIEQEPEVVEPVTGGEEVINSEHIQNDMQTSFEEVLKEFDLTLSKETSIDELKEKLEKFKGENKAIYDKIEKLKRLGFVNTPTSKDSLSKLKSEEERIKTEVKNIEDEIEQVNTIKKLTDQYRLKYPSFKFIDNGTMVKIMKKYNLFMGEAFTYSKEIPDRALDIISGFEKEIKKSEKVHQLCEKIFGGHSAGFSFKLKSEPKKDYEGSYMDVGSYSSTRVVVRQEYTTTKLKMVAPFNHFEIPKFNYMRGYGYSSEQASMMSINLDTNKFEFNLDDLNKKVKKMKEVLDPIACLEVKGGYIILDAWDEEANIPEIKNTFLN